jgi:succinate dehydrogenase hydrophobic anchor subunit
MNEYIQIIINAIVGTFNWTWKSIIFEVPWYTNYFWGLILISLVIWGLEMLFPWRKNQSVFRKDFWLDAFYMFFNFLLLLLVGFINF